MWRCLTTWGGFLRQSKSQKVSSLKSVGKKLTLTCWRWARRGGKEVLFWGKKRMVLLRSRYFVFRSPLAQIKHIPLGQVTYAEVWILLHTTVLGTLQRSSMWKRFLSIKCYRVVSTTISRHSTLLFSWWGMEWKTMPLDSRVPSQLSILNHPPRVRKKTTPEGRGKAQCKFFLRASATLCCYAHFIDYQEMLPWKENLSWLWAVDSGTLGKWVSVC